VDAPGEDTSLALALANSRRTTPRQTVDDLDTVADLRGWLDRREIVDRPTGIGHEELVRLHDLRDAIRELLGAGVQARVPREDAVSIVNAAARSAPSFRRLEWNRSGGPQLEQSTDASGSFSRVLAAIADDAIDLIAGERRSQIRACGAPGCTRFLLIDHPRRRWCSTRCSDRVRAASYYQRTRAPRSAG
jgi:predicted RNA-binding Zn ribbon-like protein